MECGDIVNATSGCNGSTATTSSWNPAEGDDDGLAYPRALQERFNKVQYVLCPLLFLVGIAGNTCTVLVVTKPQFRQLTSRYILCALAVSDSLLLCTNPFNQRFMLTLVGQDLRALSRVMCKVFFVTYRTGKMTSSWFIVLVTVERFFAVWFPLKVKSIMTRTTILVMILAIYVVMLTITGIWSFSTDIVADVCLSSVVDVSNAGVHRAFVMLATVVYSLAPMLILITITPPIVIQIVTQQRRRQVIQQQPVSTRASRDASKITVMLVAIVVMYIVCITPITLVLVLTFWTGEPFFNSVKPEFIILTSVAQWFEQLNHSMNFTLFILFSRQFRMAFLNMIGCRGRTRGGSMDGRPVNLRTSQGPYSHSDDVSTDMTSVMVSENTRSRVYAIESVEGPLQKIT